MDESGDSTGFSPASSRTFNIAFLKTNCRDDLRSVTKGFVKRMHRDGWPKKVELKGTTLFGAQSNPIIPRSFKYKKDPGRQIIRFLSKLTRLDVKIDYISIFKGNVNKNLKNAPPFVLYNFIAGRLIEDCAKQYKFIELFYDIRNKESKPKFKFDGYIKTVAHVAAKEQESFRINLYPCDSKNNYGVRAVDFVSWAIHRNYEFSDGKFLKVLNNKIGNGQSWFYK